MPPPPPKPPPGPPPPPAPSAVSVPQAPKMPAAPSTDRTAVMADIRKGARLKKVDRSEIKDRSSPLVAGGPSASFSVESSASNNSRGPPGGGVRPSPASSSENGMRKPTGAAPPMSLQDELARKFNQKARGHAPEKVSPTEDVPASSSSSSLSQVQSSQAVKPNRSLAPPVPNGIPPAPLQAPKPAFTAPLGPRKNSALTLEQHDGPSNGNGFPAGLNQKPLPSPKPSALVNGPSGMYLGSGAQTMHIQRQVERKPIPNMNTAPAKPKHPPPPLPTNPPPRLSNTMPRPVKHTRPSLPTDSPRDRSPPPPPDRPPSFRSSRPANQPPPVPPGNFDVDGSRGLISSVQQKLPPPPRPPIAPPAPPPVTNGLGVPHSSSVHSLPGSPAGMRPPVRADSLTGIGGNQAQQEWGGRGTVRGAPPLPPNRLGNSPRTSKAFTAAQEFEAKFSFHAVNELPPPGRFSGTPKTYPSAKNRVQQRNVAPAPPVGQVR